MPGSSAYHIVYSNTVIEGDIPGLSAPVKLRLLRAIEERLESHPHHYGKSLSRSLKGHRRLRVGDYRIIYRVDEAERLVRVVAIGHRRAIYKRFGH